MPKTKNRKTDPADAHRADDTTTADQATEDQQAERNAIRIQELVAEIRKIMKGEGPMVQSAVLADLTAMYVVGFVPQLREEIIGIYMGLVRQLIPINDQIFYGGRGHPATRLVAQ
jgi:hypothetical protein